MVTAAVTPKESLADKENQPIEPMAEDIYMAPVEEKDESPLVSVEAKIQSDPFPKDFAKAKVAITSKPSVKKAKRSRIGETNPSRLLRRKRQKLIYYS